MALLPWNKVDGKDGKTGRTLEHVLPHWNKVVRRAALCPRGRVAEPADDDQLCSASVNFVPKALGHATLTPPTLFRTPTLSPLERAIWIRKTIKNAQKCAKTYAHVLFGKPRFACGYFCGPSYHSVSSTRTVTFRDSHEVLCAVLFVLWRACSPPAPLQKEDERHGPEAGLVILLL